MKDVALRGLSDELHAWLKEEADHEGRSFNAQVISVLAEAHEHAKAHAMRQGRIEALRAKYLPDGGVSVEEIVAWIREDRDRDR